MHIPQELHGYIQLDRTFRDIQIDVSDGDAFDFRSEFNMGPELGWDELLEGYRTVILSEAGMGKTEEIRQVALRLRTDNKKAFFLRIEHLPYDFEDAFEVGTLNEFQQWVESTDEAWLLLDSVDEARLRSPRDFEKAIRAIGRRVQKATERVHIILTSRTSSWRSHTDLELCEQHLPSSHQTRNTSAPNSSTPPDLDMYSDTVRGQVDVEDLKERPVSPGYRIVALEELSIPQIEVFARVRGVSDINTFLDQIDRSDALSFTSRPQDLQELIEFWIQNQRIGSRLELMENSVSRRLIERDQNRVEAQPLSSSRARAGARILAAACILSQEQTIQVPEGSHRTSGIPIHALLPDWNGVEHLTLLSRPIFDEAIYGTVRFHHRTVREYLTAEWLNGLLERPVSRRKVEGLLFREQYGIKVIVPTMRPVLPWLALKNPPILNKIIAIAPEVLLEGGDPSALNLETRRTILVRVCEELATGMSAHSAQAYAAVQRFASPDLADEIRSLLDRYASNSELKTFLIRMVWIGRIESLKGEAKALALDPKTAHYARTSAIRALCAVGEVSDLDDLRHSFVQEGEIVARDYLAEIVAGSTPTVETTKWLLTVIEKVEAKKLYSSDSLTRSVVNFVERAPIEIVPAIAVGFNQILEEEPFIEQSVCKISERNAWAAEPALVAIERLINERRPEALLHSALGLLSKLEALRDWVHDLDDVREKLRTLVPQWPELNRKMFWFDVQSSRESEFRVKHALRLTDFRQASLRGVLWEFGADDFDSIVASIEAEPELDDKLVAMSLAFDIYEKCERPASWLERLTEVSKDNSELEGRLCCLLNPPTAEWERRQEVWNKNAEKRKAQQVDGQERTKAFIIAHVEEMCATHSMHSEKSLGILWYLNERLREMERRGTHRTVGQWSSLSGEFGEEVAQAYRMGVMTYWRKLRPVLRSEGADPRSTPITVILGLAGLDIEATESSDWPTRLSEEDMDIACRYATYELNGFPRWLPMLFETNSDFVGQYILREIEYELKTDMPEADSHYLLSDVRWSGQWAWNWLAPALLRVLQANDVLNSSNLGRALTVVQGSTTVNDNELAKLAAAKIATCRSIDVAAIWHAVWVGVEPEEGIASAAKHLSSIEDDSEQKRFAMNLVTKLSASRFSEASVVRQAYSRPQYLKELYLLVLRYIRVEEDIHHDDVSSYTPTLRDNAQDARNALFQQLTRIPGKEAFVALDEISKQHPRTRSQPWLASYAKSKAEQDADHVAWLPERVLEFHQDLERTPRNHRELAELGILRLLDFKEDCEDGDESIAIVLGRVTEETEMRNYIAHQLREKSFCRYTIAQEEEMADAKRPDLRFHGAGFDAPVPVELKLAERWPGPRLFERLETQLTGDYLRDSRSVRGIFVLVNRKSGKHWRVPSGGRVDFDALVIALENHWRSIANGYPNVEEISVIGIDLTKRFK